jgi:hypothetical protein
MEKIQLVPTTLCWAVIHTLLPSVLSVRVTCACTDESWNCTHLHLPLTLYSNHMRDFAPLVSLVITVRGRQVVLQMQTQFL